MFEPHGARFRRGRPRRQGRASLHRREHLRGRHPHRVGLVELRVHHAASDQAIAEDVGEGGDRGDAWTRGLFWGERTPRSRSNFRPALSRRGSTSRPRLHPQRRRGAARRRGVRLGQPRGGGRNKPSPSAMPAATTGRSAGGMRQSAHRGHRRRNRPHAGPGQLQPFGETQEDAPPGYIQDQLVLVTNDSTRGSRVPVAVEGLVAAALTVRPSPLMMGVVEAGKPVTRNLVVQGRSPFHILAARSTTTASSARFPGSEDRPHPSRDVSRQGRKDPPARCTRKSALKPTLPGPSQSR